MALNKNWFGDLRGTDNVTDETRARILEVLDRRYLRESQHVMRFRQHAERIADPETRTVLRRIAADEAEHVRWLEEKIVSLGGNLPKLVEVHSTHENAREYLRSDLDDERRCMAEIEDDKENLQSEFPDIVALLDRIETDAERNWREIRSLLNSDTTTKWLA